MRKQFLLASLALAFTSVLTAGCAGRMQLLQSPPGAVVGADYAELTFEPGAFGTGNIFRFFTQTYSAGEEGKPFALVSSHGRNQKVGRSVLFPAGKKVVIVAGIIMRYGAPGITASGESSCVNQSSFTPLPGARYRVIQNGDDSGPCSLSIVDAATGREPADLERALFPRPQPLGTGS